MQPRLSSEQLRDQLKTHFGYNFFRPYQEEIVTSILDGRDGLAILPTGSGKSLCYQLPAVVMPGTALVVSPLIALMQDQVDDLQRQGIRAAFINSSLDHHDRLDILSNIASYDLVYVAPERLAMPDFIEDLKGVDLSMMIIDEAHCISQWGHSFRPDYRTLSMLKETFNKPVFAFTATATPDVAKDIVSQLGLVNPALVQASFDRPNLTVRIHEKINADQQLLEFLNRHKDESGIIYAGTRKTVDKTYDMLQAKGFNVTKYHAGMTDNARVTAQRAFVTDATSLIVATVAFGMGIHKPDVRFVFHLDMPKTIEQYYQEIGRAGRDGGSSECQMLFSMQDLIMQKRFSNDVADEKVRQMMLRKTEQMFTFCYGAICRRIPLLDYFGEQFNERQCQACDNCLDDVERMDGTVIAQQILSCVYRLDQRFGINYVVDVLKGSKQKQILDRRHDQLSTHGLLSEKPTLEIRYYIFSLMMMGYLFVTEGDYPVLKLAKHARRVLFEKETVYFKKRVFSEKSSKKSKKKSKAQEELAAIGPIDDALLEHLKSVRLDIAREQNTAAFIVFHDRTLMELAARRPQTEDEMLQVNGIGPSKMEKYGHRFLSEINSYLN